MVVAPALETQALALEQECLSSVVHASSYLLLSAVKQNHKPARNDLELAGHIFPQRKRGSVVPDMSFRAGDGHFKTPAGVSPRMGTM